jgi:flagellar motor protein MotB
MDTDFQNDEDVIWPSYVDFMATFAFLLFIFIGSLVVLMYGQLGDQLFKRKTEQLVIELQRQGIEVQVHGKTLLFNLTKKVDFGNGKAELLPAHIDYLKKLAVNLDRSLKIAGTECNLVVLGKADRTPFVSDPFGNWNLSAQRALVVLKYLYNCQDCNIDDELRAKLVLLGEGNVSAQSVARADDRRVDLVVDCEREFIP